VIYVISGSRSITDAKLVDSILDQHLAVKDVVHVGDASGVDAIVADYCYRRFCEVIVHKADWDRHGKSAGPLRNREMADQADRLIAIWDGRSKGTKNMIDTALLHTGLEVFIYRHPPTGAAQR